MGVDDLGYKGNTFLTEFPDPPADVLRKLGLSWPSPFLAPSTARPADVGSWPHPRPARPAPKVVDPGTASTQEQAGKPPADALVLFGGKDLSLWKTQKDGSPAKWKVEGGYMEVVKGTGTSRPRRASATASSTSSGWRPPRPWDRTRTAATAASS